MIISSLKTKFVVIFALCVLCLSFTYADYYNEYNSWSSDDCYSDPCSSFCSGFEIGAEFLYWKPCINDLDYAIGFNQNLEQANIVASGCYEYLNHGYEPGFRVHGVKQDIWCGWDVSGSYTWLWAKTNSQVTPPFPEGQIFSTLNHSGFVINPGDDFLIKADNTLRYQSFDVLFHYTFDCCGPCHSFAPYWGIEGIKIEQDTFSQSEAELNAAVFDVHWDSEVLALGLKLGTEYQYTICNGFRWFTNGSFSVVAGNNETFNTQFRRLEAGVPDTIDLTFKTSSDICVSGYHLQTGLTYEKCLCNMLIRARVGYEFLEWWNIPRIRRFINSDDQFGISTGSVGSNLCLHGLFVGLDVGY